MDALKVKSVLDNGKKAPFIEGRIVNVSNPL